MRRLVQLVLASVVVGILALGMLALGKPDAPRAAPLVLPTFRIATSIPARPSSTPTLVSPKPTATSTAIPVYGFRVLSAFPHDPRAFTQGLVYQDGVLYESTGLYGQSSLRRVELETGRVLRQVTVAPEFFAEGLAIVGNRLIQLTWQSKVGFVYDKETFERIGMFDYPTEGWGLAYNGTHLIMSDGSDTLRLLDPVSFEEVKQIKITAAGEPVTRLNELEFVDGEIWANIWQTDRIARIDLATGRVRSWIDLSGLLGPEDRREPVDVLNGIAYDASGNRLFVTGKLWPRLFQIELVRNGGAMPSRP